MTLKAFPKNALGCDCLQWAGGNWRDVLRFMRCAIGDTRHPPEELIDTDGKSFYPGYWIVRESAYTCRAYTDADFRAAFDLEGE